MTLGAVNPGLAAAVAAGAAPLDAVVAMPSSRL